jgi:hypothetical protein
MQIFASKKVPTDQRDPQFFNQLHILHERGKIYQVLYDVHVPTCRTFSTQLLSNNFNPLLKLKLCESDALNDDDDALCIE